MPPAPVCVADVGYGIFFPSQENYKLRPTMLFRPPCSSERPLFTRAACCLAFEPYYQFRRPEHALLHSTPRCFNSGTRAFQDKAAGRDPALQECRTIGVNYSTETRGAHLQPNEYDPAEQVFFRLTTIILGFGGVNDVRPFTCVARGVQFPGLFIATHGLFGCSRITRRYGVVNTALIRTAALQAFPTVSNGGLSGVVDCVYVLLRFLSSRPRETDISYPLAVAFFASGAARPQGLHEAQAATVREETGCNFQGPRFLAEGGEWSAYLS